MLRTRPVIAANAASFGRKALAPAEQRPLLSADDVRLFLTTFLAGFAFVALFIA